MNWSLAAKKARLPLGFILAALYLALARPTLLTWVVGGLIALVGVIARGWAAGHIVKNDRLATTGPYAHVRNPLYFGSFLIACGFAIAAHWSLILAVLAFFILIYAPTMERERANIRGRFPDHYPDYERNVPAFIPRPTPWRHEAHEDRPFSFDLYLKHGEWKALLGYVAAMVWLYFRMVP